MYIVEYRTNLGTVKVEFPDGMTEQKRLDVLEEMVAWERAPVRQIYPK
jgi:hypothetical protein